MVFSPPTPSTARDLVSGMPCCIFLHLLSLASDLGAVSPQQWGSWRVRSPTDCPSGALQGLLCHRSNSTTSVAHLAEFQVTLCVVCRQEFNGRKTKHSEGKRRSSVFGSRDSALLG
ncbi:arylsulfatase G [Rhinolophus ferrumequinum]|uniref:Arylsulfatase G n=1 Tax=Rhinolophus ferrumequinum TaxID=59479 RepID=A0A7J7TCE0_RHIFE|nr:arylsulfatase G [Rhinolophus ferrumequinum]